MPAFLQLIEGMSDLTLLLQGNFVNFLCADIERILWSLSFSN